MRRCCAITTLPCRVPTGLNRNRHQEPFGTRRFIDSPTTCATKRPSCGRYFGGSMAQSSCSGPTSCALPNAPAAIFNEIRGTAFLYGCAPLFLTRLKGRTHSTLRRGAATEVIGEDSFLA